MTKWIKSVSSLICLGWGVSVVAQNIPLDTWRNHFSYGQAKILTQGAEGLFCATENGLFYLNTQTDEIRVLSKLSGLSDAGVTGMAFEADNQTLVTGYASGLVDLTSSSGVRTLREVQQTNLVGNKQINDVAIANGRVYLASSFGVIVIDLASGEIVENYRSIGPDGRDLTVLELEVIGSELYAITELGIQSGNLNSNLLDFNNWTHYPNPARLDFHELANANGQLYSIANQQEVYSLLDDQWQPLGLTPPHKMTALEATSEGLFVLTEERIYQLDDQSLEQVAGYGPYRQAVDLIARDGFWVADRQQGLVAPTGDLIAPNGPQSDRMTKIRLIDGSLHAFYGPTPAEYSGTVDSLGYSLFDNTEWTSETIEGFYNLTDAVAFRGSKYFSSYGFGLYAAAENKIWNETNSELAASRSGQGVLIPELAVAQHLYIPTYDSPLPLQLLNVDGTITSYPEEYVGLSDPIGIDLSQLQTIWLTRSDSSGGGINVLELQSDDFRIINRADGLPSNLINEVKIDLDDEAWIGTAGGLAILQDASFVFDNSPAFIPVFQNQELFDGEEVTALAVDGGNNIWVATRDGLSVFNNPLTERIHQFNTDNSPLPSNNVREMVYNPANGELFILTDKGLVSYRSGSSAGQPTHAEVSIFPNPVRPGYSGLVGIKGLVLDAEVKITDVNGKLIRNLRSQGGTASWDLLDYNNQRVSSGVYVIFSSDFEGTDTYIGKLAVVN